MDHTPDPPNPTPPEPAHSKTQRKPETIQGVSPASLARQQSSSLPMPIGPGAAAPPALAESIQARLLNLARAQHQDFNQILTCYARERFLYRMAKTEPTLLLKGASLYGLDQGLPARPTKDLDLLQRGPTTVTEAETMVRRVCAVPCPEDGVVFDPASVRGEPIRKDRDPATAGVRLRLTGYLGPKVRLPVQIDLGFGRAVIPPPRLADYPNLLPGLPQAKLLAYHWETAIAEKLESIVKHDAVNTRVKDFFDIWHQATHAPFSYQALRAAVLATFEECQQPLPEVLPYGLTDDFANDPRTLAAWAGWSWRLQAAGAPERLAEAMPLIREFTGPVILGQLLPTARWDPARGWLA